MAYCRITIFLEVKAELTFDIHTILLMYICLFLMLTKRLALESTVRCRRPGFRFFYCLALYLAITLFACYMDDVLPLAKALGGGNVMM